MFADNDRISQRQLLRQMILALLGAWLLFLAGGIHEGNVQEAMIRVNPDGIDVSSAVEYIKPDSGGINGGQDRYPDEGGRCAGEEKKIIKTRGKDPEKMKRIIRMVHSYEQ